MRKDLRLKRNIELKTYIILKKILGKNIEYKNNKIILV